MTKSSVPSRRTCSPARLHESRDDKRSDIRHSPRPSGSAAPQFDQPTSMDGSQYARESSLLRSDSDQFYNSNRGQEAVKDPLKPRHNHKDRLAVNEPPSGYYFREADYRPSAKASGHGARTRGEIHGGPAGITITRSNRQSPDRGLTTPLPRSHAGTVRSTNSQAPKQRSDRSRQASGTGDRGRISHRDGSLEPQFVAPSNPAGYERGDYAYESCTVSEHERRMAQDDDFAFPSKYDKAPRRHLWPHSRG